MNRKLDYLIIGGGLSGLFCAKKLLEKHAKNFLILEAKNRFGGRVHTHQLSHMNYIDLGAQWVSPIHQNVISLCKELQIQLRPTFTSGHSLYEFNGQIIIGDKQTGWIFDAIDQFICQFLSFLESTTTATSKRSIDDYLNSFSPSLNREVTKEELNLLRSHLRNHLESITAKSIDRLSLSQAKFMEKSGRDFTSLKGETDQMRIVGGTNQIIDKLILRTKAPTFTSLSKKVLNIIRHSQDNVEVRFQRTDEDEFIQEETVSTKNLIITIPPFVMKDIRLELGNQQENQYIQNLLNKYEVGDVTKTFIVYNKPFWRELGFSGTAFCSESKYFSDIYDMSCDGKTINGVLLVFSSGQKALSARELSSVEFKKNLINELVRYFGREAYNYFEFYTHSFHKDPFVQGGYAGIEVIQKNTQESPQGYQQFEKWNKKVNQNVFFVGTETSGSFNGYLEGALNSVNNLFATTSISQSFNHM